MSPKMIVYLFTDGHFSAAGNTVVCVGDKVAIEATLGDDRLGTLFSGSAVYSNRASGTDYIGVWGNRNAFRLRRLLREAGAQLSIRRTPPSNARLRLWTTQRRKTGTPQERN